MKRIAPFLAVLALLAAANLMTTPSIAADALSGVSAGCTSVPLTPTTPAPHGKTPVLFVHGIMSSAAMWNDRQNNVQGTNKTLRDMVAAIPGVATYAFDYGDKSLDWVDKEIGPALAKAISCLATESGRKVVVIAHSMGGLATRFAAAQPDGSGHVGDRLASVITLGTPSHGSELLTRLAGGIDAGELVGAVRGDPLLLAARTLIAWCGLQGQAQPLEDRFCGLLRVPDSPAGRALRVGSGELQDLPAWPTGVKVHALAGDFNVLVPLLDAGQLARIDLGDVPVSVASAVVGTVDRPPISESCPDEVVSTADRSVCFHLNLIKNDNLASVVVKLVQAAVMPLATNRDWYNATYLLPCGGVAPRPVAVTLSRGSGHGPPDSRYFDGYDISVEAMTTGDLTGDGRPETAVLLSCSPQPSNFFVQDVQIFTDGPRLLAQLPTLESNSNRLPAVFDAKQFSTRDGQLITGVRYYSAADTHASGPSIHRTLSWHWNGKEFVMHAAGGPSCVQGSSIVKVGPACLAIPAGWQAAPPQFSDVLGPIAAHIRPCGEIYCIGFQVYSEQAYGAVFAGTINTSAFQKDTSDGWWIGSDAPVCSSGSRVNFVKHETSRLVASGFQPFGSKTAQYRQWTVTCQDGTSQEVRAWILPISRIIVVSGPETAQHQSAVAQVVQHARFS